MRSSWALLALSSAFLLTACLDDDPSSGAGELGTGSSELSLSPRTFGQLVAGKAHACVIMRDGTVRCWGAGTDGQLGDGATADRFAPVAVALSTRAVELAAGDSHTCAVLVNGQVACWGDGSAGQNGTISDQLTPVLVPGVTGATAIAAGSRHTCVIHSSGQASCWGANDRGQLGDGTGVDSLVPRTVLEDGAPLGPSTVIAAGGDRTCAGLGIEAQHCWGDNVPDQGGTPTPEDHYLSAVAISLWGYAMSTTGDTTCGVGGLYSDRYTCRGTLAYDSVNLEPIAQIDGSDRFFCILQRDGRVVCRGANDRGQLARGNTDPWTSGSEISVALSAGMAVGDDFACAIAVTGHVSCWGRGDRGQTGDGVIDTSDRLTDVPVAVGPATSALDLDVGGISGLTHTCATIDGTVRCLGTGTSGQLGTGTTSTMTPSTLEFPYAVAIATGGAHSCTLSSDGNAHCWGANDLGQLGLGSTQNQSAPRLVTQVWGATAIAAGHKFTCVASTDGLVDCWGSNSNGQLGIAPTSVVYAARPRPVPGFDWGVDYVVALEAGYAHVCSLDRWNTLWCWGDNTYGKAGGPSSVPVRSPAFVRDDVRAMALGKNHTCIALLDGTVRCRGRNASGQLGDGTTVDRPTWVTPSIDRVVALDAGTDHTCALRDDGTAMCWGMNKHGQLGLGAGDVTNRNAPTAVALGTARLTSLAAGDTATCGRRVDGLTACWGLLGQGPTGPRLLTSTPTVIAGF